MLMQEHPPSLREGIAFTRKIIKKRVTFTRFFSFQFKLILHSCSQQVDKNMYRFGSGSRWAVPTYASTGGRSQFRIG